MRKLWMGLVVVALTFGAQTGDAEEPGAQALKDLKVLYAGVTDGTREKAFVEFLKPWVGKVDTIALNKLRAEEAAPYDVVIADSKRIYVEGKPTLGNRVKVALEATFTKPVIMIGAVAGESAHEGKLDWL